MNFKDIKDSISVDMRDVKLAEKISMKGIAKYILLRLIGIICFTISLAVSIFILHYFGVVLSFR